MIQQRGRVTRTKMPITYLYNQYADRHLDVRPIYQRNDIYNRKQKSMIIESILLDIPIPEIVLYYTNSTYEVIDGQQRCLSIFDYIKNSYPLSKVLPLLKDAKGLYFDELPEERKDIILSTSLAILQITGTGPEFKFELFKRYNQSTVKLNKHELRNCVYHSPYLLMLRKVGQHPKFLTLLGLTEGHKRFEDVGTLTEAAAYVYTDGIEPLCKQSSTIVDFHLEEYLSSNSAIIENAEKDLIWRIEKLYKTLGPKACFFYEGKGNPSNTASKKLAIIGLYFIPLLPTLSKNLITKVRDQWDLYKREYATPCKIKELQIFILEWKKFMKKTFGVVVPDSKGVINV